MRIHYCFAVVPLAYGRITDRSLMPIVPGLIVSTTIDVTIEALSFK
jgi:hypothetical protein